MTRDEKIIRNKVGVLELAKQLGSVSQACRIMGSATVSTGSGTCMKKVVKRR